MVNIRLRHLGQRPRWGRVWGVPDGVEGYFFSDNSAVISTPVQCFIQNSKNWGMKTAGEAAE